MHSTFSLHICISIQFISNAIKSKRLKSTVFDMVHSHRTVLVLLHNTIFADLTLSVFLSPLSQIVRTLLHESLTLRHMSTIRSPY